MTLFHEAVSIRTHLIVALLITSTVPGSSWGQDLGIGATLLTANHPLLGDPLGGGRAALRWPRGNGEVEFRIDAEWLHGRAERIGVPCAGLIEPGTCASERVRDESQWHSASAGTAIRVSGSRHLGLALTADLELASVRADTRGLASGRALSAAKMIWGGLVGVEGVWAPVAQVPLALELGAAIGGLTAVATEQLVDGYTPFENSFSAGHVRLGITWRGVAAHR